MVTACEPGRTKLGFIGIGIMGFAMCKRLIEAGYEVTVYNRNPAKTEPLVALGATAATSPRAVVEASDIIFGMVSDPAAALAVATGAQGVAAGMSEGKGYVDVSTVDAATSQAIEAAVTAKGGLFLEAPVSGSKGPAEGGQLIFLCGGSAELFAAVHSGLGTDKSKAKLPLDIMGKASFHLGSVGSGANMKLVVNGVMGTMMAALAEGMALADGAGLDQKQLVEVLGLGAMACPMFALKGPAMVEANYPTAFPLKHQQKDLRLALLLADQAAQKMPTTAAANQLYVEAIHDGHADADFSAVLAAVKKANK
jgi:glyoxylate/succinic semialdehyde reductase